MANHRDYTSKGGDCLKRGEITLTVESKATIPETIAKAGMFSIIESKTRPGSKL